MSVVVKAVPEGAQEVRVASVADAGSLWVVEPPLSTRDVSATSRRVQVMELFLTRSKNAASPPRRFTPQLQEMVAIRNPKTGTWHRGCVKGVDMTINSYTVFLVDHGVTSVVNENDISELPENMKALDHLAFKVILYGLMPGEMKVDYDTYEMKLVIGEEWSLSANAFMRNQIEKTNIGYVITKASDERRKVIYGDLYVVAEKGFLNLGLMLSSCQHGIINNKLFARKYGLEYEGDPVSDMKLSSPKPLEEKEFLELQGKVQSRSQSSNVECFSQGSVQKWEHSLHQAQNSRSMYCNQDNKAPQRKLKSPKKSYVEKSGVEIGNSENTRFNDYEEDDIVSQRSKGDKEASCFERANAQFEDQVSYAKSESFSCKRESYVDKKKLKENSQKSFHKKKNQNYTKQRVFDSEAERLSALKKVREMCSVENSCESGSDYFDHSSFSKETKNISRKGRFCESLEHTKSLKDKQISCNQDRSLSARPNKTLVGKSFPLQSSFRGNGDHKGKDNNCTEMKYSVSKTSLEESQLFESYKFDELDVSESNKVFKNISPLNTSKSKKFVTQSSKPKKSSSSDPSLSPRETTCPVENWKNESRYIEQGALLKSSRNKHFMQKFESCEDEHFQGSSCTNDDFKLESLKINPFTGAPNVSASNSSSQTLEFQTKTEMKCAQINESRTLDVSTKSLVQTKYTVHERKLNDPSVTKKLNLLPFQTPLSCKAPKKFIKSPSIRTFFPAGFNMADADKVVDKLVKGPSKTPMNEEIGCSGAGLSPKSDGRMSDLVDAECLESMNDSDSEIFTNNEASGGDVGVISSKSMKSPFGKARGLPPQHLKANVNLSDFGYPNSMGNFCKRSGKLESQIIDKTLKTKMQDFKLNSSFEDENCRISSRLNQEYKKGGNIYSDLEDFDCNRTGITRTERKKELLDVSNNEFCIREDELNVGENKVEGNFSPKFTKEQCAVNTPPSKSGKKLDVPSDLNTNFNLPESKYLSRSTDDKNVSDKANVQVNSSKSSKLEEKMLKKKDALKLLKLFLADSEDEDLKSELEETIWEKLEAKYATKLLARHEKEAKENLQDLDGNDTGDMSTDSLHHLHENLDTTAVHLMKTVPDKVDIKKIKEINTFNEHNVASTKSLDTSNLNKPENLTLVKDITEEVGPDKLNLRSNNTQSPIKVEKINTLEVYRSDSKVEEVEPFEGDCDSGETSSFNVTSLCDSVSQQPVEHNFDVTVLAEEGALSLDDELNQSLHKLEQSQSGEEFQDTCSMKEKINITELHECVVEKEKQAEEFVDEEDTNELKSSGIIPEEQPGMTSEDMLPIRDLQDSSTEKQVINVREALKLSPEKTEISPSNKCEELTETKSCDPPKMKSGGETNLEFEKSIAKKDEESAEMEFEDNFPMSAGILVQKTSHSEQIGERMLKKEMPQTLLVGKVSGVSPVEELTNKFAAGEDTFPKKAPEELSNDKMILPEKKLEDSTKKSENVLLENVSEERLIKETCEEAPLSKTSAKLMNEVSQEESVFQKSGELLAAKEKCEVDPLTKNCGECKKSEVEVVSHHNIVKDDYSSSSGLETTIEKNIKQNTQQPASSIHSSEWARSSSIVLDPDPCENVMLDSGHKMMDQLQSVVVLLHGTQTSFKPFSSIADACFLRDVHKVLGGIMMRLMRLQRYAWPAIKQGSDLVIVGPPLSGKTLGYLVPCIDLLLQIIHSGKIPKGYGPVMLILCSGSKTCSDIRELCWKFVRQVLKEVKIVVAYGGGGEKVDYKLVNGCHILISTPRCFLRLLAKGRCIVNFARLKYLVFDEADILTLRFLREVEQICHAVERALPTREEGLGNLQVILAAEKWCPGVEVLTRSLARPCVCISAYLEAIAYAHLKPTLHHITEHTRLKTFCEVMKSEGSKHKALVVCGSVVLAESAAEVVRALKMPVLVAHDDMDWRDLHDVIRQWCWAEYLTLVCTDVTHQQLRFQGASLLVHLDVHTANKSEFAFRCSALIDSLPSMFNTQDESKSKQIQPRMHIFISDLDKEPLPELVRFLKRLAISIDPDLEKRAMLAEIEKETKKENFPICYNTKAFGDCWNKSACAFRHIILEKDTPQNVYMNGIVKMRIVYVHDACNFSARLLEHTDENGNTTKIPNQLMYITRKIQKHFKNDENRILVESPRANIFCATEKPVGFYRRSEILLGLRFDKNQRPRQVMVRYIDDGSRDIVKVEQLFELPDELKAIPPQCVEIFVCRLIPCDLDWSWGRATNERIIDILSGVNEEDMFLMGKIALSLGHTLWLESLDCYQHLPTLKTSTIKFSLRRRLIDEGLAVENPRHIERLRNACARAGISFPTPPQVNNEGIAIGRLSEKIEARWAFLPEDEFSIAHFIVGDHPGRFYVRLHKFEDLVNKLCKRLQKLAEEQSSKDRALFAGDFCVGKFPSDNKWYRARVEDAQDDQLDLFFVDHGDRASVCKSEAFPLPKELITQLPFQAIECSLAGVSPVNEDKWSNEATDALYDITAKPGTVDGVKALYIKPLGNRVPADVTGGHRYSVVLVDCYETQKAIVNEVLVLQGLATQTEEQKKLLASVDISNLAPLFDTSQSEDDSDDSDDTPKYLLEEEVLFADSHLGEVKESWDPELSRQPQNQLSLTGQEISGDCDVKTIADPEKKIPCPTDSNLEERLAGFNFDEINEEEILDFFNATMSHYRGQKCLEDSTSTSAVKPLSRFEITSGLDEEQPEEMKENIQDSLSDEESSASDVDTEDKDTGSGPDPSMPPLVSMTRRPHVFWHQSTYAVWLRVDLPGTEEYFLRWSTDTVNFWTVRNDEVYAFDLKLFGAIDPREVEHSGGLFVQIKLPKLVLGVDWLRLTRQRRVPWVKVDYTAEHDREDEETETQRQVSAHLKAIQEAQRRSLAKVDEIIKPADEASSTDSDADSNTSDIVPLQEDQYDPYDPLS